ncbi:hypothetical protein B0I35DRAFT_411745 [Stachybotrys elegans]|uniref:Uncharacterized protein n=1 Tax=Stachybotrys elegans TaxID=80388 RepID=A0A8K0SJ30_9HYPO|nr:hypothetical protein B0I35DRAFT_411745 [Stachybotrys elegans]
MARIHLLLLLLTAFVALALADSAPTFCKCTCFKNSTIIALDADSTSGTQGADSTSLHRFLARDGDDDKDGDEAPDSKTASRGGAAPCSACTKAFCLNQDLLICDGAEEEDVTTMCFQRDSNKDKIIVWAFIVGTVGLLGWAAFKRLRQLREDRRQSMEYSHINDPR